MRTAAFELAQEPASDENFSPQAAPASEEASLTRPHSFASPARHARTNEIEIDFPVYGGTDKPN